MRDQDVTAFWVTAAPLVPLLAEDPGNLPEGVDLLQTFIDVDVAETTALLHVVTALSDEEDFRRRGRSALATRRQPMPPQVAGLAEATVGDATVFSDSQGDNLMIEVVLPKAVRAVLVVYIARDPLPYVKDTFLIGQPLQQVHADYRRILAESAISLDEMLEVLSPAQAGAALTEALTATPVVAVGPDGGGEQWPLVRPFVEFVRDLLPAGGRGYDGDGRLVGVEPRTALEIMQMEPDDAEDLDPDGDLPPWILEDGTDLLAEFLASEQARDLDPGEATADVVTYLFLVAAAATGDPLEWTEGTATWLAEDLLPTHPVLPQNALDLGPTVLPALITWAHARNGISPSRTAAVLEVVHPLLEDLPARYADPRNRARRLEGYVEFALESGEPGELRFADLALRVGGYEELRALEVEPLPAEPLRLDEVPEDLHERAREIDGHLVAGLDRLTRQLDLNAELFGGEVLTACRRLLMRVARIEPAALRRRASTRITAGALAWIIGRGNDLLGQGYGPVHAKDLMAAFELSSTPSQRAETLMRAAALPRSLVGVALGDAELLVSSGRREILRILAVLDG